MAEPSTNVHVSGHVERTNDRDYEVEERFGVLHVTEMDHPAEQGAGGTELWSQL